MIGSGSRYIMTFKTSPAQGGTMQSGESDSLDSLVNALNMKGSLIYCTDCTDVKIIDTQHEVELEFEEVKEKILAYNVTRSFYSPCNNDMRHHSDRSVLGLPAVKNLLSSILDASSTDSVSICRATLGDIEEVIEIKYKVKSND